MSRKSYLIAYAVEDGNGNIIKDGTFKVKRKLDKIHAQVSLEEYLRKKHGSFGKLIVHSCVEEEDLDSMFGGIFSDIFK